MFDELLEVPPDAFCSGDAALALLDECRQQANAAAARLAHAARDLWEERLTVAAHDPDADAATVWRSAVAEVAVSLGCSHATAQTMIDTAELLRFRAPSIDEAFGAGDLDYAKARTIAAVLTDAGDDTITAIEPEVLAAAAHLTPKPLRAAIWRAWMRFAPEEAAAVRAEKRGSERKVYVRRGEGGLSWLSACLTDLEGWEAETLIDELADSVCAGDLRTRDNRRADALMALLHGESHLTCRCDDPTCARAGTEPAPRRPHLLQILVDIETLLGLSQSPATLPDGSPLDPELVRVLAEDASWQGLLTEMRTLAESMRHSPSDAGEADSPEQSVTHVVARGRTHRPGTIPTATAAATPTDPAGLGLRHDRTYAAHVEVPLPSPDGHGGHAAPPQAR